MIPTIDELFERYSRLLDDPKIKPNQESFEVYFSGVASGKEKPILLLHNAMLAAHTVMVVLEHVKHIKKTDVGSTESLQDRLDALLDRSGMDISPCRRCGIAVISIPDGLALCKDCAEKAGE